MECKESRLTRFRQNFSHHLKRYKRLYQSTFVPASLIVIIITSLSVTYKGLSAIPASVVILFSAVITYVIYERNRFIQYDLNRLNANRDRYNRKILSRKDKINNFYAPLLSLLNSSRRLIEEYRNKSELNEDDIISKWHTLDTKQKNDWIQWMINAQMPINEKVVDFIFSKYDIVMSHPGGKYDLPDEINKIVLHTFQFKNLIKDWEKESLDGRRISIPHPETRFPENAQEYIKKYIATSHTDIENTKTKLIALEKKSYYFVPAEKARE